MYTVSTNAEYAEMTTAKLLVEGSARIQRCFERKLSEVESFFVIHGFRNALKCIARLPVKASAQNLCCLEYISYDPFKNLLIFGSRDVLKCKASGRLKVHD